MLNTVSIGDLGESYAIMKFTQAQTIVSKPLTNNARYDLIVECNNRLYRVQVKTTGAIKDGKMEFATKTTNYTKGNWKSTSYTADEIDVKLESATPKSHASADTTYGIGTGSNYGHVKLSDSTSSSSAASAGIAASPKAVKAALKPACAPLQSSIKWPVL